MKKLLLTLTALIVSVVFDNAYCAFKDSGWGARPAGMGGSFVSVADDVNAIMYNAAGIGQLKNPELSFMYSKLYMGLDEVKLGMNYFAYGQPIDNGGAWAVSWANFISNGLYREDTVTLDYSYSLKESYPDSKADMFVGANLKYLRNGYTLDARTKDDPVFKDGRYSNTMTVDLGFLANFDAESVGVSIKNINEPDIGLNETEKIPREYKLGLCYLFGDVLFFEESISAFDFTYRDKDVNVHFGLESFFADKTFSARAGANTREITFGFGYLVGFSDIGLQVDYAFVWPLKIEETAGTHRMSLICRFGLKQNKK